MNYDTYTIKKITPVSWREDSTDLQWSQSELVVDNKPTAPLIFINTTQNADSISTDFYADSPVDIGSKKYIKRKMLNIAYFSFFIFIIGVWFLINPILFANSQIWTKKIAKAFGISVGQNITIQNTKNSATDLSQLPFVINIPKIELSSRVVSSVNAKNQDEYKEALKVGVAHAKGTAFPGQGKMIYIFGHSTDYSWNVTTYNALFYQIKDLVIGDEIELQLGDKKYTYRVSDKKTVGAKDTHLIEENLNKDILILQTCWPPGTSWKRMLVFASPKSGFGE